MLRQYVTSNSSLPDPGLPMAPGIGGEILSLGASMIIIVGLIVLLGWLYSRSRFIGGGSNDLINVVATRAVGPKERLVVVEVADQQLLVGMTPSGMRTLHVLDRPVAESEPTSAPQAGFAGRLRAAFQEIAK